MASSPSSASSPTSGSRPSSLLRDADSVPAETLVEHLLAAKRALSSMNQVLLGNDLATQARRLHEEAAVMAAQTAFLERGMGEQVKVLQRMRSKMSRAYDAGRRDFKALIRTLDAANGRLEHTMDMLRATIVEPVFRPPGEGPRNLLEFIDEKSVDGMRNALKESIAELQAAQTSFDGDLLRFDTDLRALARALNAARRPSSSPAEIPPPPRPSRPDEPPSDSHIALPHLVSTLTGRSHVMAEELTSLTRHFDQCVTAVRATEGGAALARRRAAEVTDSQDGGGPVSISGVISAHDSNTGEAAGDAAGFEPPISAEDRAEMISIVLTDAAQVDDVVADITAELAQMETEFTAVKEQTDRVRAAHVASSTAFRILEDIASRIQSYVAAEAEFVDRWDNEKLVVADKLDEMENLRQFYEGYASAYDTLILEAERRRAVEDKIQAIWRKAKDTVDKLADADQKERDMFRHEIGEYLPTDLWVGMTRPLPRWELVPIVHGDDDDDGYQGQDEAGAGAEEDGETRPSTAGRRRVTGRGRGALGRNLAEAAREGL